MKQMIITSLSFLTILFIGNVGKSYSEETLEGWVFIQAGSFRMGSQNGKANERPVHQVTISHAFLLKENEVTQGEWRILMGNNPSAFSDCGDECPVENVTWWDSLAYSNALSRSEGFEECYELSDCKNQKPGEKMDCTDVKFIGLNCKGYRLPTEAEWEYAARAGTTGKYYSKNLDSIAWYYDNSDLKTHRVGQKKPNSWGLYDMLGNVWEWTWDSMEYGAVDFYPSRPQTDPMGPKYGGERILRGGSYQNTSTTSARHMNVPHDYNHYIGFRLARTLDR